MQNLLIKNGKVLLFKDNDVLIEKKDILVENGKISKIENDIDETKLNKSVTANNCKDSSAEKQFKNFVKIIDAQNCIVMPGLINTHAHIPMSIFRETTEGCKLYEWLNKKIWPREDKLTREDVYWASMLSYIEMISTGTTCINDQYFFPEEIRRAAVDSGVRAIITRPIVDTDGTSEQRIQEFRDFYESRNEEDDLITYSVAPHALYTCSKQCLEATADLAREYNLPIHVHFLESVDEIDDIKNKYQMEAVDVLKKHFDGIHTILAHAVHLNSHDIEVLKTMDCGIAHNPISNLRLGCTIADTTKYMKEGINVALGTDGQGSGSNLDMFETMRVACLIQGGIHENEERLNAKDVLKMATINGAKLLEIDDKVGSIEIGKDADLILVDVQENLDNITMLPNLNEIANLVYNTSSRNVKTTIVKGNILMENRKIQGINVEEVIQNCNQIAERIAK